MRDFSRKDLVAEYLSQGLTPAQIKARMGLNHGQFQSYVNRIRKDLGPQAV